MEVQPVTTVKKSPRPLVAVIVGLCLVMAAWVIASLIGLTCALSPATCTEGDISGLWIPSTVAVVGGLAGFWGFQHYARSRSKWWWIAAVAILAAGLAIAWMMLGA